MTTADKATRVVVTCQQRSQTGQGGFGITGGGGIGPALPHLCRSPSNLRELSSLSIPVPQERTSVGLRELEPLLCPCFEVPAGVLAHGSWGPMAFCPFLRRQLGTGCLPVGDPGDLFPRDPGQKVQSQPGSGVLASCWRPRALKAPTYLNPLLGQTLPIPLILALRPSKAM